MMPFMTNHRGYMGAAETVALYKREAILTVHANCDDLND